MHFTAATLLGLAGSFLALTAEAAPHDPEIIQRRADTRPKLTITSCSISARTDTKIDPHDRYEYRLMLTSSVSLSRNVALWQKLTDAALNVAKNPMIYNSDHSLAEPVSSDASQWLLSLFYKDNEDMASKVASANQRQAAFVMATWSEVNAAGFNFIVNGVPGKDFTHADGCSTYFPSPPPSPRSAPPPSSPSPPDSAPSGPCQPTIPIRGQNTPILC